MNSSIFDLHAYGFSWAKDKHTKHPYNCSQLWLCTLLNIWWPQDLCTKNGVRFLFVKTMHQATVNAHSYKFVIVNFDLTIPSPSQVFAGRGEWLQRFPFRETKKDSSVVGVEIVCRMLHWMTFGSRMWCTSIIILICFKPLKFLLLNNTFQGSSFTFKP